MIKRIQIAPLKKNFQRIIDFDRVNPSNKIVVFVSKNDTEKQSKNYKFIEDSLSNLRQYCELARIEFNMQVIDFSSERNFLNVVLDFTRSFLLDYVDGSSYLLNLGDETLILNIALLQAAQLIKAFYPIEIIAYMDSECTQNLHNFTYSLVSSFDTLVSPPVTLKLLQCVNQKMNFKEIERSYQEEKISTSLGTISNHINHLETLGIIEGKRVTDRHLTNLGHLVMNILDLKQKLEH